MGEEIMYGSYNRSYRNTMTPRVVAKPLTPEEQRKAEHRRAAEDIKRHRAALNEAKERYARYDAPMESRDASPPTPGDRTALAPRTPSVEPNDTGDQDKGRVG